LTLFFSGKTTLLHQIWGIKGERGLFAHTAVPTIYQMNQKVYVADFPGSNSLDYHAKTFSICGAMNNLIILVIPFSGDISQIISQEITKVFAAMHGSDSTQVNTFPMENVFKASFIIKVVLNGINEALLSCSHLDKHI
jgi:hypothetical protein